MKMPTYFYKAKNVHSRFFCGLFLCLFGSWLWSGVISNQLLISGVFGFNFVIFICATQLTILYKLGAPSIHFIRPNIEFLEKRVIYAHPTGFNDVCFFVSEIYLKQHLILTLFFLLMYICLCYVYIIFSINEVIYHSKILLNFT